MTPETLVAPEVEEVVAERKDMESALLNSGSEGSQNRQSVSSTSELEKLNESELKAAIRSAWKMHEHRVKKDMAPCLFWLRLKLRMQGSRNDIHDMDRGFGAWVEDNLDITRRTADRWADKYGLENGLMERKPTSGQTSRSENDDFYENALRRHGKNIQINYWVSQSVHKRYEQSLKSIRNHFKIANDKEAILKGVFYAAETIATRSRSGNRKTRRRAG